MHLQLWDTAGQADYKKLRPLSYPGTDVFIVVFSLVLPGSLENVESLWVPEIKEHCPDTPFILVGTQDRFRTDFPEHEEEYRAKGWEPIPKEKGEEMKRKLGASDYIECDALKQYHLKEVFETAIRTVIHPKKKSPTKEKKSKFHLFKKKEKK